MFPLRCTLGPSEGYMRMFGTKPLHEPVLSDCQLGPWEVSSVKYGSKYEHWHFVGGGGRVS